MSDIVTSLRAAQQAGVEVIETWDHNPYLFGEAADEIERLRAAIEYACHSLDLGRITSTVASELRAAVAQVTSKGPE